MPKHRGVLPLRTSVRIFTTGRAACAFVLRGWRCRGTRKPWRRSLRAAARQGRSIRPVGYPFVERGLRADDILARLAAICGLREHDAQHCRATVGAGSQLTELSKELPAAA